MLAKGFADGPRSGEQVDAAPDAVALGPAAAEKAPASEASSSSAPEATTNAPEAAPEAETEEAPASEAGTSSAPEAAPEATSDAAFSREYARQLWQEASTGITRHGVPLDNEQRLARIAKLRRNAVTLAPRYRNAQLTKVGALEQRFVGYLTSTGNDIKSHVNTALEPLIARAEGRVPPRREGQTAAQRKVEIDQVMIGLRHERTELVAEERAEREMRKKNAPPRKRARVD